jgi:GT2 family glycosyltransferase
VVEKPLLSIVIPSYTMDRLGDIFELLINIRAQTYPNIEIILIAERSTALIDEIKSFISENNIHNMKVLPNGGELGAAAARNSGIEQAKGDIIAFIDDDAVPFADWAQEIVNTFNDNNIIAVTGPSIPLWEDEKLSWVPEEFFWIIGGFGYEDWDEKREVRNVTGTNMAFRREAFDQIGLFSAHLGAKEGGGGIGKQKYSGEETEFCIRLRNLSCKRILYNPKVKVRHKVYAYRVTYSFIARRAYSEGFTKAMFRENYPTMKEDGPLLNVEYRLLGRIITKLTPSIMVSFFTNPQMAVHRLSITVNAVFFVAVGYFHYYIQHLTGKVTI